MPKKRKIAIVNVFFPPQAIGGATRVVIDNISVLQEDYTNDFELVAFTSDNHHRPAHQVNVYTYSGIRVYKVSPVWRENMDWHYEDANMGGIFRKFLDFEKPDLVHFHCIQRLTGSIVEETKKSKVPYLVTVHDAWWISDYQFLVDIEGEVYLGGHPNTYAPIKTLPQGVEVQQSIERHIYLKNLLNSSQKVLAVSDSFADLYRKNGIVKVSTNKNGISSHIQWKPKVTESTNKVVCAHIGGMADHKGYNLLQIAIMQASPKNIEMLVVDHGKEEDYEKKDYWGGVPVTYIGRVAQENVVDLYTKIDVLFAPSIWPESYGLVTRETAACGCWVIASNIGAIGEDIIHEETGLLIEANSIAALIEAIEWIDNHKEKCKRLPKKMPIRYSNEQVAELVEYYKNCI